MRKIILVATLLVAGFINAQVSTTEEEYNYLTKGLKIQEESGLGSEVKKGYELLKFGSIKYHDDFTTDYFEFKNSIENKTKALLIKIIRERDHKTVFLCLPINNESLFEKFAKSTYKAPDIIGVGLNGAQLEALKSSIWKALPIYIDKIQNNQ